MRKIYVVKVLQIQARKTCAGSIEGRPIRAKAKAKPKPLPKPVYHEEEQNHVEPVVKNQMFNPPPANPIASLTQHYQILQQEYIKQKQQKYNSLCKVMFESRGKKKC